jgi:hypothetical protein
LVNVTIDNRSIDYYDDMELKILFADIKANFESTDPFCPIITYGLTLALTKPGTDSILDGAVEMKGVGQNDINFDFKKMFKKFKKYETIYLTAVTESKVIGYQTITLK